MTLDEIILEINEILGLNLSENDDSWNFQQKKITPEVMELISVAISKIPTLRHLDFTSTGIDTEGAKILALGLKANLNIESLNFLGNHLPNQVVSEIFSSLKMHTNLKSLDFGTNSLYNDKIILSLANILKANKGLEKLDLLACSIEHNVLHILSEAIATHPSLKTLELGNNPLDTIEPLIKALKTNESLQTINLGQYQPSESELIQLADVLKSNITLTQFQYTSSKESPEIHEALLRNEKIDKLAEIVTNTIESIDKKFFSHAYITPPVHKLLKFVHQEFIEGSDEFKTKEIKTCLKAFESTAHDHLTYEQQHEISELVGRIADYE